MRILGQIDGVYFFAPRKKEDSSTAIDKIIDIMQGANFTHVGITSYDDLRKNGYADVVERIAGKIDFATHNLIIVKKA